jgi:hypothetical protein
MKFRIKCFGPFRVIGFIGKNAVRLRDNVTGEIIKEAVHIEKLKKYHVNKENNHQGRDEFIWEGEFGKQVPKTKNQSSKAKNAERIVVEELTGKQKKEAKTVNEGQEFIGKKALHEYGRGMRKFQLSNAVCMDSNL